MSDYQYGIGTVCEDLILYWHGIGTACEDLRLVDGDRLGIGKVHSSIYCFV